GRGHWNIYRHQPWGDSRVASHAPSSAAGCDHAILIGSVSRKYVREQRLRFLLVHHALSLLNHHDPSATGWHNGRRRHDRAVRFPPLPGTFLGPRVRKADL